MLGLDFFLRLLFSLWVEDRKRKRGKGGEQREVGGGGEGWKCILRCSLQFMLL